MKNLSKSLLSSLVLALVLLPSCRLAGGSNPRVPIPTLTQVAVGLNGVNEAARVQGWPEERRLGETDSVFARNGVSREDFRATVAWLSEDPIRWKEVGEELIRSGGGTAPPVFPR
jgi:hypothetical protein